MLKCYIEGRNKTDKVNPDHYKIAEGAVFVENGNETLDSGTIILPQLDHEIEIEPYDIVVIYSTDDSKCKINRRRMCVDTYTCTQTSLNPAIFKYEISLFSETKLLEGILCPSMSITKLATGQRSVGYYLSQYLREYGTKISVNPENLAGTEKFSFASRVLEKFNSVVCPELQWNEPTLREVFNDLMMVADCIPVVRNNVIDYMYLGGSGSEITAEQKRHINYITKTQSSQDYVSEIKMNVKNALNNTIPSGEITSYDDIDIPKDATALIEEIGFKNYETYQLTTERLKLETQFPIWRLFYCELVNRVWGTVNCKRDEMQNMNLSWSLSSGTTQETVVEDGLQLSPVTNASSQTFRTNVNTSNVKSNVFHYKIIMKCSINTNITFEFHESDIDIGHQTITLPVETEFKTFEGDIEVNRSVFDYIEMYLVVNSQNDETITINTFELQGLMPKPYSHTFDRTELLKIRKNITPYILEYTYWQTRDIYYQGYGSEMPMGTSYQNTCLYFKRGQKGIFNFSAMQTYKFLWIESQTLVFELMINDAISRGQSFLVNRAKELYFPEDEGFYDFTASATVPTEPGSCRFRMAYEPLDECTFKASKYPLVRNQRQIVDNQTNSYVDINRLGMLEYLKAKRLGNKIKIVNGRYGNANENDLPVIFNKIDGSIIFKKEIAVYDNYIVANYQATENYVLKDYFTSVKSKLRNWRIVGEEEAFTRSDVLKFFVGRRIASINNSNVKIPSYQTVQEYLDNFKYCVVQFNTDGGRRPVNPEYNYYYNFLILEVPVMVTTRREQNALMCEFSKHICGNSVLFTFKMLDNTLAGKYVYNNYQFKSIIGWTASLIGFTSTIGGQQRNIKYTDNNGEITGGVIRFFNKISNPDLFQTDECFSPSMRPLVNLNGDHEGLNQYDGNFMDNDGLIAKIPFTIHKDNKEILQITIQFEISDEANNMFLGKK